MMTFAKIKNEGKYYLDLAREDYYVNGGEPDGIWGGAGAEILRLKGKVEKEQFKKILKGFSPCGKSSLCQTPGEDHTSGWDLTFNAPKSVSVVWAAADPNTRRQIQAAQLLAVREALSLLEENAAYTRRGKAGTEREKVAGLIAAMFEHSTSREVDPHLHTHAIIANVAPRHDGSWGTLDSRTIMLWQKAAGMAYKLSLAESLRSIGFQTSPDGESFKIEGISQSICDYFSRRSQQIVDALKEKGIKYRASSSGDIASLSTRKTKNEVNRSKLFSLWQEQLSALGFTQEEMMKIKSHEQDFLTNEPLDAESLADTLTESNSVFTQQDIYLKGGLQAIENSQSLSSLRTLATQFKQNNDTIDLGTDWRHSQLYTTRNVLNTEQSLILKAKKLRSAQWATVQPQIIDASIQKQNIQLSDEQQFAVRNVCNESQFSILQGSAGSGKSTSMKCVRDIYLALDKNVIGASIARSAAKNLEQEAGIEAYTIARLLVCLESNKAPISEGDVLIIDEAGQIGTFYLEQLLKHAAERDFKIILVGEDRQLDAIQHPGVLRYLSSSEVIGSTRVETIRRQTQDWDRQAVADFRDGYAHQALAQYQKHRQLHIQSSPEATKAALVDAWTTYRHQNPSNQSMVIAQGWIDVIELNNAMRSQLQREDRLGDENILVKATVSDRDIDVHLSVGERVRFTKNDYKRNYTNGDLGTVTKVEEMPDGDVWIRVKLDSGRETQFMASTYANEEGRVYITQAYAQTVYSCQGLTVDGDVFVYYTQTMDRAHSYVACSRHKNAAHIFANEQEFEADIPSSFVHAPRDVAIRESIARNMSRDLRPKLASEYLSQKQIDQSLHLDCDLSPKITPPFNEISDPSEY